MLYWLTDYNLPLVTLSVAIAVLAAYTALDMASRVTATQGGVRLVWLLGGAVAMGIGIWSMHFIGMLAVCLPFDVRYDFLDVFLSALPAIAASGLARPSLGGEPFGIALARSSRQQSFDGWRHCNNALQRDGCDADASRH